MKRQISFPVIVLLIATLACGGSSNSSQSPPKLGNSSQESPGSSQTKRGWLCDYDSNGKIRLWTAASMDATVKDVVGTCVGCCVDVTLLDEDMANGILFYHISVGGQSGWVDVDYYYPRKPGWSSN